ncbi:Gag-pol Polyprotein [Phytophthora megakarya]|uniref:Gag-pol Polyprotein n=1 Tax=Phytophthora megakarya TaxID=4795 RepID=A0A225UT05_9STRA|nr:Gag-pol Polyprotein [Phytophthora megakarya]
MVSPVDLFRLQQERFVEEQKRTPWIMAMVAYLKDGALALDPQLRTRTLLMAPNYEVKNGVTKTLDKVRKHAFWHGWKGDVAEYVRALDAIGPLVTTPRGNKFILVFADYFTRWVEAFAIKALDTVTLVETMVNEVISRHGVPERLLGDQGSNFISELARSFYETLGIKKLFGAAYQPQTQGLVERFNGTLIGMLKMFVNDAQTDWDLYLPRVLFAYRTSYHEALKDSPFFSLYGYDPVLPLDLAFLNTDNNWKSNEVAAYRRRLYLSPRY